MNVYRSNIFLSMVILNYYDQLILVYWIKYYIKIWDLTYNTYYSVSLLKYVNRICVFFELKNSTTEVIVLRLGKNKTIEKIVSVGHIISVAYISMVKCRRFCGRRVFLTLTHGSRRNGLFEEDGSIDNEQIGWFISKIKLIATPS